MIEIWKDIPETNGAYSVSSLGFVRSNARVSTNKIGTAFTYKTKILKALNRKNGYLKVNLCLPCGVSQRSIHRLVAGCFLPNPGNLPEINHLDNDPTNNALENLEWCSRLDNNRHAVNQSRNFIPSHNRLTEEVVSKIKQMNLVGLSGRAIAKELGVSRESVKRHID